MVLDPAETADSARSVCENAFQSSESSDFLKFNLRYLSIEEGYRYVRHGVGKPWLHTFGFWKNFGHKNSSSKRSILQNMEFDENSQK